MNKHYKEIRGFIDTLPVIDSHEHYASISNITLFDKPMDLMGILSYVNYYIIDMVSNALPLKHKAGTGIPVGLSMLNENISWFADSSMDFKERCAKFVKIYEGTSRTGMAKAMEAGLKYCWGIDKISVDTLTELNGKFGNRDSKFYEKIFDSLNIKAKIVNFIDIKPFVDKKSKDYSKYSRFAFPLSDFHNLYCREDIKKAAAYLDNADISTLEGFMAGVESYLQKCVDFGVVCMKDVSAYIRALDYDRSDMNDASKLYTDISGLPEGSKLSFKEARCLNDWLFSFYMSLAEKYDLPVQLHTGYLSGLWGNIRKANAVSLINLLEMHPGTRFCFLHGNWPYMDECLYLGRNFPNVWLDLSYIQSLDPIYCIEFMKRALLVLPHTKILAYGGDTAVPEWTAGYLLISRGNVALALSELAEQGWIDTVGAKQVAADWFFNNANELYDLGFDTYKV